jgi:hypothetical protein
MPAFGAISRRDLIAALHAAGFEGPYSAGLTQLEQRERTCLVLKY